MKGKVQIKKRIHHGRNVSRVRLSKNNMKQFALGERVGMSQQQVSDYEKKAVISDNVLEKFAKALDCPVSLLKEMEDDPLTVIIENNNIETNNGTGYVAGDNIVNNPVDKIVELCEKLLEKEQETIALLERLLKEKM